MKIMVTSFKSSHICTTTLSAPSPAVGHSWPMPLTETPGHLRASLGQSLGVTAPFSWVLLHTSFCLWPPMVTSSKKVYAIPRSAAPRAPVPLAVHCWPLLQYSCLENPTNSIKRQKDRTLKDELPRSVGAQYVTGDQWRNNSRKNEGMEPEQKQHPVVDVTVDGSKVWCCKEQYCIRTWNVMSVNQGKLEAVKQEMARVNIDILFYFFNFFHLFLLVVG